LKIRAVLLDLGNVLWDDDPLDAKTFHVAQDLFRAHGLAVTAAEIAGLVDEAVESRAASVNDYLIDRLAARAGLDARQARAEWQLVFGPVQEEMVRHVELFEDVLPGLERLDRAGIKIAAATNYGGVVRERLDELGAGRFVDFWGLAPELGVRKPEPAFFKKVLGGLRAKAGEAAMVGDRIDNDIAPARQDGLATVRIVHGLHAGQAPRGTKEKPDYVARSFGDAVRWILVRASR
jgi:FMN phosphatase YigB (HAD superfamily)